MKPLFTILFIIFFTSLAVADEEDEPIYQTGNIDEWKLIDSIPFPDYPYIKRWSKDSTVRLYCFRQRNMLFCVGAKYLKAKDFLWNPKYLNRLNLP